MSWFSFCTSSSSFWDIPLIAFKDQFHKDIIRIFFKRATRQNSIQNNIEQELMPELLKFKIFVDGT